MEKTADEKKEKLLTEEAKQIIKCYQRARESATEEVKVGLFKQFCDSLIETIYPSSLHYEPNTGEELINLLIENKGDNTLYFGSGSSGSRIFFRSFRMDTEEKTLDRKIRWMVYPKEFCVFHSQKEAFRRWEDNFGSEQVDLMQKIE